MTECGDTEDSLLIEKRKTADSKISFEESLPLNVSEISSHSSETPCELPHRDEHSVPSHSVITPLLVANTSEVSMEHGTSAVVHEDVRSQNVAMKIDTNNEVETIR